MLISNQVHYEPMNNPDDISPTLNRRSSARILDVIHRLLIYSLVTFAIIFFGLRLESTGCINLQTEDFSGDLLLVLSH